MKKLNKKGFMNLFLLFSMVAIIGVIFVSITISLVSDQTTLLRNAELNLRYNGSIDMTLANIPISSITSIVDNSSGVVLVDGTNYTLTKETGVIANGTGNVITNGTPSTGYNVTYLSEPSGFIEAGTTRTVLNIIPLLFIVVLIVFMLGFRFAKGKE